MMNYPVSGFAICRRGMIFIIEAGYDELMSMAIPATSVVLKAQVIPPRYDRRSASKQLSSVRMSYLRYCCAQLSHARLAAEK